MPEASTPIAIRILDKEYNVGCPPSEREALLQAAQLLDRKMREMRDGGRVIGAERVAVITALNLAHELLQDRRGPVLFEPISQPSGVGSRRRCACPPSLRKA